MLAQRTGFRFTLIHCERQSLELVSIASADASSAIGRCLPYHEPAREYPHAAQEQNFALVLTLDRSYGKRCPYNPHLS